MESNQPEQRRRKIRRVKKPETSVGNLRRTIRRQLGKNEDGKYQWEIVIGVVLVVVLIIAFIVYVYLNMDVVNENKRTPRASAIVKVKDFKI